MEKYAHGTRAKYVTGCRCTECRAANARYYHQRQQQSQALAAALPPAGPSPAPQVFVRGGVERVRTYSRACPGVNGNTCPISAHLRKDSKGGCCRKCRSLLVWNGMVPAAKARAHMAALSAMGVGYRSVADACDVARIIVQRIQNGQKLKIRAETERRILAVDQGAVADGGLIDARPTWKLLDELILLGLTKTEISRRLGSESKVPALTIKTDRIRARTAQRVMKVHKAFVQELGRRLEIRDEIEAAGGLGSEWFGEGYSFMRRGGSSTEAA